MLKKDLGLFILIMVVAAVVAFLNPRFLSQINISNTANQVGLFGIFSIGEGFVIITGGIDLSVGSEFALLGVLFIDLLVTYQVHWAIAVLLIVAGGMILGSIHGFLVTRMRMQPFVVTLCGLLIYRGVARYITGDGNAGFAFGETYPWLDWLTKGKSFGVVPHTFIAFALVAIVMGSPNEKAREEASAALLNYGYTFFETLRIKAAHETVLKPRVYKSANEFVAVSVPYDVYATVARGEASTLKTSARLNHEPLLAPLAAGASVGELSVADASGTVIARVPLASPTAVPKGGLWTRMVDSIALWFR